MDIKGKLSLLINTVYYGFWTLVIYITVKYLAVYILPFIISFAIVYALQKPMIMLSNKTKISKNILTLFALLLIIALILLALCFVAIKLFHFLADINNSGVMEIATRYINICQNVIEQNLPKSILQGTDGIFNKAILSLTEYVMGLVTVCIKQLPGLLFSTITSVVSACFLAFEYDNFIRFIKRQMSENAIERTIKIKRIVNESLLGFTKGYLVILLFTFCVMMVGLKLLGISNAVAISIIIAAIDILPVFGTGLVLLPWSVFALINGNTMLSIGLVILYVVYSLLRYFLEPRIIGKKVGVNPLISLIAMFVGLKLFGLIGLILAPVTISVLTVLQKNSIIKLGK